MSDCSASTLCRLITDCLRTYTEPEVLVSSTKDTTKDLLIALSKVSKLIESWSQNIDYEDDNDSVNDDASSDCMANLFTHLVPLLTFKSRYVQHATGNVLVSLSQFIKTSGSNWDLYIHFLRLSLDVAISCASSYCFPPPVHTIEDPNSVSSSFVIVLKPKLKEANWSTSAEITRVLRRILKILKQDDCDDKHYKIFLDSVCSCISNLSPLISQIHVVPGNREMDGQTGSCVDLGNIELAVFLGIFLQFVCSLVEDSSSAENHSVIFVINKLVPQLLSCCLSNEGVLLVDRNISHYFGYKLLVLMVRLSFQTHLDSSIYFSWLQLLHKHFEDLLSQPITECKSEREESQSLDGSPFLLHVSDEEIPKICTRHLQRRAIFFFLRCSFSLVRSRNDTDIKCVVATLNSCLASETILDADCCSIKKGLLELHRWLERHFAVGKLVNREMYMKECMNFATSFISLYVHEDDLLFKVLLELLDLPLSEDQQFQKEKLTFQNMKEDILFHLSNVFNPFYLFMAFLAELRYDHQVLLDYLISNDTGISCGEYLLKCLRVICDSWQLLKGASLGEDRALSKRRKIISRADLQSAANETKNVHPFEEEHSGNSGLSFREAENCLLSLKHSIESLHKKNLFPYNPHVLLKRLQSFQELCLE